MSASNDQPTNYVTYDNFDIANLVFPQKAEKKTIPGTGPTAMPPTPEQYYHQIVLKYKYPNGTEGDLFIEGPEVKSSFGLQEKASMTGKNGVECTIPIRLDLNDPEHLRFIEVCKKVHAGCSQLLEKFKLQVGLKFFKASDPEATGLPFKMLYFPTNKETLEIIEGQPPSMYFKLFDRGNRKTLFNQPNEEPVSWDQLKGVEIKFYPLLHIKRIYVSSKASIQTELSSGIITHIEQTTANTKQVHTIARLTTLNPDLKDRVAAQFAKVNALRSANNTQPVAQANTAETTTEASDDSPTFSGIGANVTSSTPANGLNLPSFPNLPTMPDFTAGAPSRSYN